MRVDLSCTITPNTVLVNVNWQQMLTTIGGGAAMLLATLVGVFFIPVFYVMLQRVSERQRPFRREDAGTPAAAGGAGGAAGAGAGAPASPVR